MRQDRSEDRLEPARQKDPAALNADEHQIGILLVLFSNFVGDTGQHPLKSGRAEQHYFMGHNVLSFATSRDRTLKDRKRQENYFLSLSDGWRPLRHFERCRMIQSVRACSNPMS